MRRRVTVSLTRRAWEIVLEAAHEADRRHLHPSTARALDDALAEIHACIDADPTFTTRRDP